MEPLRPQPKVGGQDGSQTPHGNTYMELVDVHLQFGPRPGTGIDECSPARDNAHLDRYSASGEGAQGHPVDPKPLEAG